MTNQIVYLVLCIIINHEKLINFLKSVIRYFRDFIRTNQIVYLVLCITKEYEKFNDFLKKVLSGFYGFYRRVIGVGSYVN